MAPSVVPLQVRLLLPTLISPFTSSGAAGVACLIPTLPLVAVSTMRTHTPPCQVIRKTLPLFSGPPDN
jgi:hypothetical protein